MAKCNSVRQFIFSSQWSLILMPDRTGHPRLMSAVRKLGMRTGKSNQAKTLLLECQVSNQGLVVDGWRDWSHYYRVLVSVHTQPSGLMNFICPQGARAPKIGWIGPKKLEKNFHTHPFTWFTQQKPLSRRVLLENGYIYDSFHLRNNTFPDARISGRWNGVLSAKAVER